MLSDAELQGIAAQTANMAKRDIERGGFSFLLAAYNLSDVPPLYRMDKVERIITARLGENWLNSGDAKDRAFMLIRFCVKHAPPDALAFVSIANGFSPTAKFAKLTPAEQHGLIDAGHDRHHVAVLEGLLDVCDILAITVQTPERVCLYKQKLRDGKFIDQPDSHCLPQEQFGGRMKMFGKESGVRQ